MLIYIIAERGVLTADDIRKNEKLKTLLELRKEYKIPLLILLTHSDTYCNEIKKSEQKWKDICKNNLNINKKNLLDYINEKSENDFKFQENDIIHVVLVKSQGLVDEEIVNKLPPNIKEAYDSGDANTKKLLLAAFRGGMSTNENEVDKFLDDDIKILRQNEVIKKIKEKLPSQYHNALIQ